MIYVIRRSSMWDDDQPCEEAVKRKFEIWHTMTCSETEFNEKFSSREGLWRSKGKNHSITSEGYITRQEGEQEAWSIDVKTLEDLHKLIEKYGNVIVSNKVWALKAPCIEICDFIGIE